MKKMKSQRRLFIASLILFVIGIICCFIGLPLKQLILKTQTVIRPYTIVHPFWSRSFVLPQEIHMFNWTNPKDIYDLNIKPKFNQIGPYKFDLIFQKENVQWNDNNGSVTFQVAKYYYPKSGNLTDKVTTIDLISIVAASASKYWSYFARRGLSFVLSMGASMSITANVGQLLFEGYSNVLMKASRTIPWMSQKNPVDKFAFFYKANGSADFSGVFSCGTGVSNLTRGKLNSWNYQNRTNLFSEQCDTVRESVGEFFPRHLPKTSIRLFASELCRAITLEYVGEEVVFGITGYKFSVGDYALDNGTKYPENKCYCNGECLPSGLFNISACQFGAPFFASLPHFQGADPYYRDQVEGLHPTKEHQLSIVVEPETGFPLKMDTCIQANILIQPIPGIVRLQNIRRFVFPLFWGCYHIRLPIILLCAFKLLIELPFVMKVVGLCLICGAVLLAFVAFYKTKCNKQLVSRLTLEDQTEPLTKSDVYR